MNPNEYVRAIKRRWLDVAIAVIVAVVAGLFISQVAPPRPTPKSYEATSVLLASGNQFAPNAPSIEALAELTTVGQVPTRVATAVGYQGNPADLAAMVQTSTSKEAGILRIKVTTTQPELAKRYADAFARGIVSYLHDLQASSVSKETAALQHRLDAMEQQIAAKEEALKNATPTEAQVITEQRDALVRQYGLAYETYRQLASSASDPVHLDVIQSATAREVSTGGIEPPHSRTGILILAALLGLLAGIILVLILDRFDSRIRTRQVAEKAFGAPVLAEIPYIPRLRRRSSSIKSLEDPRSSTADAFRIVAAILSMPRPEAPSSNGNGKHEYTGSVPLERDDARNDDQRPRRILVTSPGPSDGKTTVTANLASVFGARGTPTTVFSCDLRRPYIHHLFGVPSSPGLAEAFSDGGIGVKEVPFLQSPVAPNVRVVPSGSPPEQPGEILGSDGMHLALWTAEANSGFIVIDTAPVLSTSDAAPLISEVDGVIVVARAGRTTTEVAERTAEVLKRLNAPVLGVILNAAAETNVPRRYYSYRYYRRPSEPRKGKGSPRLARHRAKA
jgi:capsular exopolysaccharide synthesis family protein